MKLSVPHASSVTKLFGVCALGLLSAQSIAAITYEAWPTSTTVVTADASNAFGGNLSGLYYQPAGGSEGAVLWGVQNSPSRDTVRSDGTTLSRRWS